MMSRFNTLLFVAATSFPGLFGDRAADSNKSRVRGIRYFLRISLGLFGGLLVLAGVPAQAQEDWKAEPKSVAIADVTLTDVVFTEEPELGVVSGGFALTGNMGQENGITYGVVVFDTKDGTLLDAKTLGGPIALFQGESRQLNFQYVLPDWLSGEISVKLLVENDRGVLLGASDLVKKTMSGTDSLPFSCRATDVQPSISCESSQDAGLTVRYSKNSPLGEKFGETILNIESGESSVDPAGLLPGQYFAFISDRAGKTVIVPLRVKGTYGQIKNISVARAAGDVPEATILVYGSALSNASLSLEVKGKDGAVCFSENQTLTDPAFVFKLKESCTEGTVIVMLKNKDGAILDEVTEPFSVQPFSVESEGVVNSAQDESDVLFRAVKFGLFFLIGLGILIFGIQWFRKRRGVLALFVFGLSFAGMIPGQDASALTQYIYLYSTNRGEFAWTCNIATNLNRATFAPGDTATLSTTGQLSWDAGSDPGDGNCYNYYILNVGQTAPAFDGETPGGLADIANGSMTRGPSVVHSFSGSTTFTMPATLSSGSHYLRIYSTVSGDCNGNVAQPCSGTNRSAVSNLSFTISPSSCDRGCGGSVQWRGNATNAVDDFTCPSGSRLMTNRGSWTGPGACQGTFTLDPFGGTMSCVADAACSAPPTDYCHYTRSTSADCATYDIVQEDDLLIGQSSPPLLTGGCATKSIATCTDYGAAICNGTMIDATRVRYTCNLPAPSCNWTPSGYIDGRQPPGANALHNSSRCTTPNPGDGTPLDSACNAGYNGGQTVCCDTGADCFRYTCSCAPSSGPAPTLILTGTRYVGLGNNTPWSKVATFFKRYFVSSVSASGPAVNINLGESAALSWTTTGAASCTLTVPGQAPQAIAPAQIASGTTVVSGLSAGSHTIRMTCVDTAGMQMVMDTVTVNVTPNELQICPPAITMTMGSVYQMRAFYLIGGVDCSSLGPAIDVSNLVTWTSASPVVAAVGNSPTGGRINAGFTSGTANISISSYAGRTAPISRVTVVGGYVICPAAPSIYVGDTVQLRAYFSALSPIDCGNLTGATDVTGSVTWTSSDTGVATVAAGLVTGVTSGSTIVSLSPYNGATAVPVTVTVSGGYAICPASAIVGSTGFSFRSYYNPSGAVNCSNLAGTSDVTGSVTWTSSNTGVATVGNGGTAGVTTPVSIGSSNISTTPYLGIPSGNAVANVICIPSVSCASAGPTATAANMCPGETFTISDGCSGVITCPGTRICDFNWKEVGQ